LRTLVSLGWLAGFIVVPEGLAAPFAEEVGAGTPAVGLLLSACPAGMVLGAYLLGRDWVGIHQRLRLLGPLAVGTSLPLALYLFGPGLIVALMLFAITGFCAAYQITAGATFVRLTPDHQRGQALGLARSGLVAAQGIGVAAGGVVAEVTGTVSGTIGAAGVAGTLCAIAAATAWSRVGPDRIAAALEQGIASPAHG
jgi:predicted MFS family arabinose efflux permease